MAALLSAPQTPTRIFYLILQNIMKMEASTAVQQPTKCIKEGKAEICLTTEKVFYNPVQEFNRDLSIAVLTVFAQGYRAEKLEKAKKKLENGENSERKIGEYVMEVSILEALSATGLRSIRYAKEIPNINKIVANDLSEQAVETIRSNVVHNGVESLVEANHDDACMLMYKHKHPSKRFSAIDLDPYGCPSVFLDSAVQAVQDGGLLLVTATDMAVLAGNSPETCYCKYGAISLKTKCCHEMALRIMLQCIESHANRYSRYIVPLLSISADFYIRVFVKIYSGAIHCKKTTSKLSMAYHCVGCDNVTLHPLGGFKPNPSEKNPQQTKAYLPMVPPVGEHCAHCNQNKLSMAYHCVGCDNVILHPLGGFKPNPSEQNPQQTKAYLPMVPPVGEHCAHCNQKYQLGGPIWSDPIHDEPFVSRVLSYVEEHPQLLGTSKRIQGVLAVVREELGAPLYYTQDKLFGRVHAETMPMLLMRSAILNAGYKVSFSHASKLSVKTNAPARLIWDIVRTWVQTHPVKANKIEADPVAKHILSQPIQHEIDLTERGDANPLSRRDGRLRFQYNPAPHWGPGTRANINVGVDKMSKALRNQNKSSRDKAEKREHSPLSDDEARKKMNTEPDGSVL